MSFDSHNSLLMGVSADSVVPDNTSGGEGYKAVCRLADEGSGDGHSGGGDGDGDRDLERIGR